VLLEQEQSLTATGGGGAAPRRSLVLVAGSGRSGTSLFTGVLQRLGFYVPQPEVPADDTNPRGFAESQWVVDFHTRLLKRAGVQVADAQPSAWAQTADVGLDEEVQRELRSWLSAQYHEVDDVIIKDPRLSWFLPLWRRAAEDIGAGPRVVTMLRHPAAVIQSKQRSYGAWQGDVSRTAGWVNLMLFTERATRDAPRLFVGYDDLLDDWTLTIGRVGEALDLTAIRDAPSNSMRDVHAFVDRSLSRSRAEWDGFSIPAPLQALADEVWELISRLGAADADAGAIGERLDAARAAYIKLYADAEAIAQSSIHASRRRAPAPAVAATPTLRLIRRVPRRYRRVIPHRWRALVVGAIRRSRR
jgi:hypothetical protein